MEEEIQLFEQPWHQERAIFAGPDQFVWWVTGAGDEKYLCLYKQGNNALNKTLNESHDKIQIGPNSLLY